MSEHHKVKNFVSEHKKAEITAGVGAVVAASAILATFAARNNRRREDRTLSEVDDGEKYLEALNVFRNEKIKPHIRALFPDISAHIYLATHDSADQVVMFGTLLNQIGTNKDKLAKALGYLGDAKIIAKRQSILSPRHQDYYATEPLVWAASLAGEEIVPELHDAIHQALSGVASDNWYSSEDNPDLEP